MTNNLWVFEDDIITDHEIMDVLKLENQLKYTELSSCQIRVGSFFLQGKKGISEPLQYSHKDFQLLDRYHDYTFSIQEGEVELSLQLSMKT